MDIVRNCTKWAKYCVKNRSSAKHKNKKLLKQYIKKQYKSKS